MPQNRVKQRVAALPFAFVIFLLLLVSLPAWATPIVEPPDYYCQSGIRDSSGQCCAVGESVVDGVCTLVVRPPPGDAIGDFCSNPGNWDSPVCGGGGGGGCYSNDGCGDGGGGDDGGGDGGDDDGGDDDGDSVMDKILDIVGSLANLTPAQNEFVDEHPEVALDFLIAGQSAESATMRRFGRSGNNDESDAFRHGLWNAFMAFDHGASLAEQFATAHEQIPNNPTASMNMDLHNNQVGRELGVDWNTRGNSRSSLGDEVNDALKEGRLQVISPEGGSYY